MIRSAAITLLLALALWTAWQWRPKQAPEPGVRLLMVFYAALGAWALWFGLFAAPGREPADIVHLKPTIVYWGLALVLFLAPPLHLGYPSKALLGTYFTFSNREWRWINRGIAALFALLGGINLFICLRSTEDEWVGFKFSYMVVVLIIILCRFTFVWLDTFGRIAMHLYTRAKAYLR
jgi:intracellular septation protein A